MHGSCPALLVSMLLLGSPAQAAVLDYLYAESNEGGSSGGHVALRLGDRVFDYQHHAPGILRLSRREAGDFLYTYAYLQNRPIHVTRLQVDDPDAARLTDRLNGLYLAEQAQFRALAVLDEDHRVLAALANTDGQANPTIDVPGAGYFFAGDAAALDHPSTSPALLDLRRQVEHGLGRHWIHARLNHERQALRDLEPAVVREEDLTTEPMAYPRLQDAFSERYRDGLSAIAALEVLRSAPAVVAEASLVVDTEQLSLSDTQVRRLEEFRTRLTGELQELLSSTRRDWGFVMLVGMARLDLLERSIRTRRLEVLDAFPADALTLEHSLLIDSHALPGLMSDASQDLTTALARLTSSDGDQPRNSGSRRNLTEAEWNDIEAAANRYHELAAARASGRGLRVTADRLIPSRAASQPLGPRPDALTAELAELATAAARVHDHFAAQLQARLAYRLVGRNCVSEMVGLIDETLGDNGPGGGSPSAWTDPDLSPARTIPFLSSAALRRSDRMVAEYRLPSWREQSLAALGADEDVQIALRESNTLTSTVHQRAPGDSYFVMFADRPALRPLVGTVNLVAATGATAWGLAALPLRGPRPLAAALRGMLFSLPELAFVQIRKGSFVYVDRDRARLPEWW